MLVVLSTALMLVDLLVAVIKVTVSVAINAVRSFCNIYAGDNFC